MDDQKLKKYLETTQKHLCLSSDIHPIRCFRYLIDFISSNNEDRLSSFSLLELCTNGFTEEQCCLLHHVTHLASLEVCILKGGRRGDHGQSTRGGLKSLPLEFQNFRLLTHLDLSFNQIKFIPQCLSYLSTLLILKLDFNDLTSICSNICALKQLEELTVRKNKLSRIADEISQLNELRVLNVASNQLQNLPENLCNLPSLLELDISANQMKSLPKTLLLSQTLENLSCSHNNIDTLPSEVGSTTLSCLDVRYNHIVDVCDAVKDNPKILLQGNVPRNLPQSCLDSNPEDDYSVPTCKVSSDICELLVDPDVGARYELPSGIIVTFPRKCINKLMQVYCKVLTTEVTDFKLRPTDQLLSSMLDLRPNGLTFIKPIRLELPYTYTGFDWQKRQIIVRVTFRNSSGSCIYEDLASNFDTAANDGCCRVLAYAEHFSMFAVVARLVEDTVTINKDSSKSLYSSVNSFNKIKFPGDSVSNETKVTVQVLSVDPGVVNGVTKSTESYASDVLHVNVLPKNTVFQRPVTVHLALPEALMGKSFDHKELRLMKCLNNSSDWNDVTELVELIFSTVDVSFEVDSFSKFWLVWSNVCGVAKLVYRRLITYQVQFIAMQRSMVPSVVIAQCVRAKLTEERIKQLKKEGYTGDDSYTVVQELMEGDHFKIKVLGELRTKIYSEADREHMEKQVLCRRFHSQYPPEKSGFSRFCIEPVADDERGTPTGYVAFYRIVQHFDVASPDDVKRPRSNEHRLSASKRRFEQASDRLELGDNLNDPGRGNLSDEEMVHLDDVLIVLKKDKSPLKLAEGKEHELNFGELGTGMFNEANLRYFASEIGSEWRELGTFLGLSTACMDSVTNVLSRLQEAHPRQPSEYIFRMLRRWAIMNKHEDNCVESFVEALKDTGRTDLAHKVDRIYRDGIDNFNNALKKRRELSEMHRDDT